MRPPHSSENQIRLHWSTWAKGLWGVPLVWMWPAGRFESTLFILGGAAAGHDYPSLTSASPSFRSL
jgi:hypothetical protein